MKKIIITILIILMIGGIMLATREVVKGHCGNSKCTYDVYTKEMVDELLAEKDEKIEALESNLSTTRSTVNDCVVKGNDIAIITGTITVESDRQVGFVETYPDGFDNSNSIPIAIGSKKTSNSDYIYGNSYVEIRAAVKGFPEIYLELGSSLIGMTIVNTSSETISYDYKIVLMRIN